MNAVKMNAAKERILGLSGLPGPPGLRRSGRRPLMGFRAGASARGGRAAGGAR